MDANQNYQPKFDPETGQPLSPPPAPEAAPAAPFEAAPAEAAPAAEAPFQPVQSNEAPFQPVQAGDTAQGAAPSYQPVQAAPEAPFQAAPAQSPGQPPYQAAAPQAPYQAQPYAAPAQQSPYPAPQQGYGQPQQPHVSGMQYSNQPPQYGYAGQGMQPAQTNGLAITSLILGVVSLFLLLFSALPVMGILSVACGIGAFVCGLIGMKKIDSSNGAQGGKGIAIAGVVCGLIGAVLGLVFTIACLSCYSRISDSYYNWNDIFDGLN